MRRAGIRLAALGALCAMVVAGCGGGDGDDGKDTQAGRAAQTYVGAYNSRDFERLCGVLSASYKEEREISDCPEYFKEHTAGATTKLSLVDVQVNDKVATAHVRSESEDAPGGQAGQSLALQEQAEGSWQVTDVTSR